MREGSKGILFAGLPKIDNLESVFVNNAAYEGVKAETNECRLAAPPHKTIFQAKQ